MGEDELSTMHVIGRIYFFGLHLATGLMFLLQGMWLVVNVFRRHYRSLLTEGRESFQSQLWYPGPFTKRLPLESVTRGVFLLLATVYQAHSCCFTVYGRFPEQMQHAIAFASQFLSSLFEVLASCGGRRDTSSVGGVSPMVLPAGADRVASMLSAVVTFFVFHFHFHHEVPLQAHIHSFFAWFAAMLVLAHVAEMLGRYQVWMALLRPYVLVIMGQWFCQTGFVLYFPTMWPRTWDDSSNASIVTVNFLVSCHLVITFVMFVTVAVFVRQCEMSRHSKYLRTNNNIEEYKHFLHNTI